MTKENNTEDIESKREALVSQSIDSLPIISGILSTLERRLPRNLYYHAKSHTDDVLREVVLFALVDGLPLQDMRLLAIAAAFHDAGFMESPVDNERIAAKMAREAMRKTGEFSEKEIETVAQMIMDTRLVETRDGLKQIPTIDLSRYLLDADLSNFGREDFFDKGELQRKELGYDRDLFLRKTYELINNHKWLTNAAFSLRQTQKSENIERLRVLLEEKKGFELSTASIELGIERLVFLSKLPLLLNSTLETRRVVESALEHLKQRIRAEAATVFLLEEGGTELSFWALKGGDGQRLEGIRMPADRGIAGWVIANQSPVLITNVHNDPRFFDTIDKEGTGFKTKSMICVPLIVRGDVVVGAIQVLNKIQPDVFSEDDLLFVEQFGHQVALAIDNSRLYESLAEKNKKLEVLDKRRSEMIQVIAHEFRTPLNVIKLSSDMISSGEFKDQSRVTEMAARLGRSVDTLTRLITQVKNLSLVSSGDVEPEKTLINADELIPEAAARFRAAAAERNISLSCTPLNERCMVKADRALVLVALGNLISNAIRFTPDGGKIALGAAKGAGLFRVSVKDEGIGIEKDQLPLIFEKFYEVGSSMNHSSGEFGFKSGGLGIGLATARAILQAHGSAIEVSSEPGKGSEFSFSLPLAGDN